MPYRLSAPPPRDPPAPAAGGVRARRAATAAVPALLVIAGTFLLPWIGDLDGAIDSPLAVVRNDGAAAAWMVTPPFATAFLLALFTLVARARRRAPGRLLVGIAAVCALSACVPFAFATLAVLWACVGDTLENGVRPLVWCVDGACWLGVLVVCHRFRAVLRGGGWMRWWHLHVAAALVALFEMPLLMLLLRDPRYLSPAPTGIALGGAALLVILGLHAITLRASGAVPEAFLVTSSRRRPACRSRR